MLPPSSGTQVGLDSMGGNTQSRGAPKFLGTHCGVGLGTGQSAVGFWVSTWGAEAGGSGDALG